MKELELGRTGFKVLVDDDKYREFRDHTFRLHKSTVYVTGPIANLIRGHPGIGMVWDHIDGNPLNNQASNLRLATQHQNLWNRGPRIGSRSRFKGVGRDGSRWTARIRCNGRPLRLGAFSTEEDAARAYDKAAKEFFGEFAYLNFREEAA